MNATESCEYEEAFAGLNDLVKSIRANRANASQPDRARQEHMLECCERILAAGHEAVEAGTVSAIEFAELRNVVEPAMRRLRAKLHDEPAMMKSLATDTRLGLKSLTEASQDIRLAANGITAALGSREDWF